MYVNARYMKSDILTANLPKQLYDDQLSGQKSVN
jgi:hypothetical protein